jgi:hypothetical protein
VVRAQAAGAAAVLLVDDGRCERFNQRCMPGADKANNNEPFSVNDDKDSW